MNFVELIDGLLARSRTQVRKLTRSFDARPQRERIVLLAALSAVTFWLTDKVWITPAFERSRAADVRLAAARDDLGRLRASTQTMHSVGAEQERQMRADLAQWHQHVDTEAAALRNYEDTLVGPDHMVDLLRAMLPRDGRVKVRELKSLDHSNLMAPQAASASAAGGGPALYRHGVELTLEGGWGDLFDYLQALETMPRHVLWDGMTLKVAQHPTVMLTLRLHTLSLNRGWLEI